LLADEVLNDIPRKGKTFRSQFWAAPELQPTAQHTIDLLPLLSLATTPLYSQRKIRFVIDNLWHCATLSGLGGADGIFETFLQYF